MKKIPLKLKITLWFSAALIIFVSLAFILVISVSNSVLLKNLRNDLIMTVEDNYDEVEFHKELSEIIDDNDLDRYLKYKNGYIEIDDDFIVLMNGIYSTVYDENGKMIYGENPPQTDFSSIKFEDRSLKTVHYGKKGYYIYDRRLTGENIENMWIRAVVSHERAEEPISDVAKRSMLALIFLVIFGIVGGYIIAKKSLKPIREIEAVARDISQSGDLKKRIHLDKGDNELYSLADTFDTMFDKLEQSFESEKQFTNDVSHELRTPMAVIMAQCEYALEEEMTAEEYIESFELIQRQGRKMSNMINQMLEFSRIERRSEKYPLTTVNYSVLVRDLCADLALIKQKNISIECEAEDGIQINGNPILISRMVNNLVSNAYRYGKENGTTSVKLYKDEKAAILCVKDNGIGIEKDQIEKIFHRFYQVDPSHSGGGSGLGLSMVREIVAFHGGKINVESEPGQGSEFTISIPIK